MGPFQPLESNPKPQPEVLKQPGGQVPIRQVQGWRGISSSSNNSTIVLVVAVAAAVVVVVQGFGFPAAGLRHEGW